MSDRKQPTGLLFLAPGTDIDKLREYWLARYSTDNPIWIEDSKLVIYGKMITVTYCNDCLFYEDHLTCKARQDNEPNTIYWDDPMPPAWCPLKDGEITVKLVAKTS